MLCHEKKTYKTIFEQSHLSIAKLRSFTCAVEFTELEKIHKWWFTNEKKGVFTLSDHDKLDVMAVLSPYIIPVKTVLVVTQTVKEMHRTRANFCGRNLNWTEALLVLQGFCTKENAVNIVPWGLRSILKSAQDNKFHCETDFIVKNMSSVTSMEAFPDKHHFDLVIVILSHTKRQKFVKNMTNAFPTHKLLVFDYI